MSAGPGQEIMIRNVRSGDLAAIMALEVSSFPSPWTGEMYLIEFVREDSVFLVAEVEGRLIGYVLAWIVLDESHILKIAVEPRFRRQGIGRALMAKLSELIEPRGVAETWLEVRAGNEEARAFYQELGFRVIALRRGYYSDTGEDAVVMARKRKN